MHRSDLRGETLSDLLCRSRPLSLDKAYEIAAATAAGLQILHSRGIVHRDLKPSNIMLTARKDGTARPVVMDFGLAKTRDLDRNLFDTRLAVQAGSPYFMSPELL